MLFEPTHAARRGMRAVVLGTLDDPDLLRIELPKISESVADYWALFDIHLFGKPPKLSFLA
ncbi:MAG TPA: hypothetical protein VK877_13990 [Pseudolabrys sp.]|nr:hypothetical protein [Pseudolabrys sp.]